MAILPGSSSTRGGAPFAAPRFFRRFCHGMAAFPVAVALFLLAAPGTARGGTAAVSVTATVLSKSNCKFDSKTATLGFGSLDPGNSVDATAGVQIGFVCRGSAPQATFVIVGDDGLYETGPGNSRMRHATILTEFLPYSLVLNPSSGTVPKNAPQTLTISGTVRGIDYQGANAGNYSDMVVISINP